MGRSRRRARLAGTSTSAPAAPAARTPAPAELRRTLGAYLAGAIAIAILVLVGTVTLAGSLAPWLVLLVGLLAAMGLYRWASARLAVFALTDEDRVMQTLAGGLLIVALLFAVVAAIVLTVA